MSGGGTPLVSVIMNCLDGAPFVRGALASILSQTYENWEVVFWDNGSSDESVAFAESYGDPRIRTFTHDHEPLPLGAARAAAVDQARGDYLAFLDVDDLWLPHTLATLVKKMEEHASCAACFGGQIFINERGEELDRRVPPPGHGDLFAREMHQFEVGVPAMMFRAATLKADGLNFDPSIRASEEYCLFMQVAAAHPVLAVNEPVAIYRFRDTSLSVQTMERWADEREYTLRRIMERHPELPSKHPKAFAEAFARASYYRARHLMSIGDRTGARRAMRKTWKVDWRYAFLFALLFVPGRAWTKAIEMVTGRRDPSP